MIQIPEYLHKMDLWDKIFLLLDLGKGIDWWDEQGWDDLLEITQAIIDTNDNDFYSQDEAEQYAVGAYDYLGRQSRKRKEREIAAANAAANELDNRQ